MRGQISVEMILLVVIILAIVALVASNFMGTAEKATGKFSNMSESVFSKAGEYCLTDSDCESGHCVNGKCQ
jgi:uncharacterized protein (UPF0333 family)